MYNVLDVLIDSIEPDIDLQFHSFHELSFLEWVKEIALTSFFPEEVCMLHH